MLHLLGESHTIILNWVKAHVRHELNEAADELAKTGTASQNIVHVHPPRKLLYGKIKTKTMNKWKMRWKRETTCRQTRLMLPKPNKIFTKYLFTLTRQELSLLLQFVTGHNYLRCLLYTSPSPRDRG